MRPKTSRDLPPSPPQRDEQRERESATIKDANETDQSDRDNVHGDGDMLNLDKP